MSKKIVLIGIGILYLILVITSATNEGNFDVVIGTVKKISFGNNISVPMFITLILVSVFGNFFKSSLSFCEEKYFGNMVNENENKNQN